MSKFAMYGKLTAQPGKREELVRILLEAAEHLKSNSGCELYIVNEAEGDPDTVWVTELWRDAEAHAASLKDEKTLAQIASAKPLIAGADPVRLRPVGGKGL